MVYIQFSGNLSILYTFQESRCGPLDVQMRIYIQNLIYLVEMDKKAHARVNR